MLHDRENVVLIDEASRRHSPLVNHTGLSSRQTLLAQILRPPVCGLPSPDNVDPSHCLLCPSFSSSGRVRGRFAPETCGGLQEGAFLNENCELFLICISSDTTYTRYHSTEKSSPPFILRHVHVYFFPTAQYLRPHHIVEKWVSQSEAYQRQNDQCYSVLSEFRQIRSSFTRHIGPHRFRTQLL